MAATGRMKARGNRSSLFKEEEKIEKQEEKGQSPLTFLRNRNALRMEQKRREEDTVVIEPVSEDTDTTTTETE